MGRDSEYDTDTAAYDFSPSGDQLRASEYYNVHPRHQSYPLIKQITPYINPHIQRILVPVYYLFGGRAALTLEHVLFTTVLTVVLTTPPTLSYITWQYITSGSLPTVPDLTSTISLLEILPLIDQITLPVLVAAYVFIAYSISTLLHAPWDEFAPGYFNYHKNRVDYADFVTERSPSRITIIGGVVTAVAATGLLYLTFAATNLGIIATLGIIAFSATGYLGALFFGLMLVPHAFVSVTRLVLIPAAPFILPVSHTEFGVILLTAGIVLKLCYDIPIGQLTTDWNDDGMDYYPRPKWVIGTWGVLIAATILAVLGGPILLIIAGYITAQLTTIAFFVYRTRVTGSPPIRHRRTVVDYHGTTTVNDDDQSRFQEELKSRLRSDAVTEFFNNPLPTGDDEVIEEIRYAVKELNEAAEPYIDDPPLVDESTLESLSKPQVKRINRDAIALADNEEKPPRVRRAARRLERVTDQALADWKTNET